jgi:hypothetical protein
MEGKAPFGPSAPRLLLVRRHQGPFWIFRVVSRRPSSWAKTFSLPTRRQTFFSRPKLFRRGQKNFFSPDSPTNFFSRPKLFRRGQKRFLSRVSDKLFLSPKTFSSRAKTFPLPSRVASLSSFVREFVRFAHSLTQSGWAPHTTHTRFTNTEAARLTMITMR